MTHSIYVYILLMAAISLCIRVLPLTFDAALRNALPVCVIRTGLRARFRLACGNTFCGDF